MNILINIENAVPRQPEFQFETPLNWTLREGQHWAIVGPNGAGKTLFSNIVSGGISLKEGAVHYHFPKELPTYRQVKTASFRDIYSLADFKNMYYQQRWNATEEDSAKIGDMLKPVGENADFHRLIAVFGMEDLLDKRLIFLSGGELRKFLIVRMLLSNPKVLILDNAYIGLDTKSRNLLNDLFERIAAAKQMQIVLLLSDPDDIPSMVTHVAAIKNKTFLQQSERESFMKNAVLQQDLFQEYGAVGELPTTNRVQTEYENALKMENICIRYGSKTILKDLSWSVKKGEKWALLGPNGSGKSTLLSLVCADNPQGYANTFYLFDRKRGSGESIWDIKKRIGYVSPEIHLYFQTNQFCLQIVGSGFFDSIGLFRKCSEEQLAVARAWMAVFGIEHLADKRFMQLSFGEQRMLILARAFVKNPELLILDEPLHGLDKSNKRRIAEIIESFCRNDDKTLIYVSHYPNEIPGCISQQFVLG
jgi:molybdate transport system ATP-binding protein